MKLPDFADERLKRLTVCCDIHSPELFERFRDQRFEEDAQFGDQHRVRLIVGASKMCVSDDHVHFHFEVADSFGDQKSPATSTIDHLLEVASQFDKCSGKAWIKARYKFSQESFPKNSIVDAFLGLPTEAGGAKLLINGMRLRVQKEGSDEEGFDEIEWWRDDDGNIVAEIDALESVQISDDLLIDAESTLLTGLNRFLLGVEDEDESQSGSGT